MWGGGEAYDPCAQMYNIYKNWSGYDCSGVYVYF